MKKSIMLIICTVASILCTQASFAQSPGKYLINGKTDVAYNGSKVYLYLVYSEREPMDSATVVDGFFKIEGTLDSKDVGFIQSADKKCYAAIALDGTPVTIDLNGVQSQVIGGKANESMNEFRKANTIIDERAKNIHYEALKNELKNNSTTEERKREIHELITDSITIPSERLTINTIFSNLDNVFGAYIFSGAFYRFDNDEIRYIFSKAGKDFIEYKPVAALKTMCEMTNATSAGKHFVDFEQADPDGKMHKLSDYAGKGNYVLVDFWASWCAPCIIENRDYVLLYKKYHSKGFEILGVSLDKTKDAWVEIISGLKMEWPQVSDLNYVKNSASTAYGVKSIPETVLIGPDGTIIARGLRGEALAAKLAEIYK